MYGPNQHPRGHSFISYLYRLVLLGKVESIAEALKINSRHEGWHLIIDKIVNDLIKPQKFFPSQEGWTVAISIDERYLLETSLIPFNLLTSGGLEEYEANFRDLQYSGWSRLFQALYFLLQDKEEGLTWEDIWPKLSTIMIEAAVDIAEDDSLMSQDDAVKFGNLAKKMIDKLGFEQTEVEEKYNQINSEPTKYYEQMVDDKQKCK